MCHYTLRKAQADTCWYTLYVSNEIKAFYIFQTTLSAWTWIIYAIFSFGHKSS